MLEHPLPKRAPWDEFPDVVIVASQSAVKNHPDYDQAKEGNILDAATAAKRLAVAMASDEAIAAVRSLITPNASLVPVHALERQGFNRIPAAFAELLAERLDLEVETSIIQVNVVNHTGATGWHRLASAPLFEGDVQPGRAHLLVDDFVGQGGTLANLRGHIIERRGDVIGAVCLTGRADSAKLALSTQTLESLRLKHGHELEAWWLETFGYDFASLTESEARYLLRVEDADTVRARLAEARLEGHG